MRTLHALLQTSMVERIAWTLLHFLWQGAALAALLGLALFLLRRRSAQSRYLAACITLLIMSLAPLATYVSLGQSARKVASPAQPTMRADFTIVPAGVRRLVRLAPAAVRSASGPRLYRRAESLLPWVVVLWLSGVGVLAIRLLGGWIVVQRLANRASEPITGPLYDSMVALAKRVGIKHIPRLLVSERVQVPTVLGCLRSVILLPASVVTGLNPEMLETILLHELAHIRRYDYLINLWQSGVEMVLFYHPAVWWVSQIMRTEREHCCDDLVIVVLKDRKTYVRALASLEELRSHSLALAATDGSLLRRIRRILGEKTMHIKITPSAFLGGVSLLVLGFVFYLVVAHARPKRPAVTQTRAAYSQVKTEEKAMDVRATTPAAATAPTVAADAAPAMMADNTADFSGLTELYGPGIVLTLSDSQKMPTGSRPEEIARYLIHDQDLRVVVNDLFAAGAEAVSIGDQRIVSRSTIQAVGPFIQINGVSMSSPFVVRAIGNPDHLFKAVGISSLALSPLRQIDTGMVSLRKDQPHVVVPAFQGDTRMRYAHQTPQSAGDRTPAQSAYGAAGMYSTASATDSRGMIAVPAMPAPPTPSAPPAPR